VTVCLAGLDRHGRQSLRECVIPDDVLIQFGPPDDEDLLLETCRGINKYIKKECIKLVITQKRIKMHGQQNIKNLKKKSYSTSNASSEDLFHCINHTRNVVVTRASSCGVNVNMDVSCLHWVIVLSGTANHYTNIPVIWEYYVHHLAGVREGQDRMWKRRALSVQVGRQLLFCDCGITATVSHGIPLVRIIRAVVYQHMFLLILIQVDKTALSLAVWLSV
jgi:hypothetical protein